MSNKAWRHTVGDGRGPRDVYCDGVKLSYAVWADERRGIVICIRKPFAFRRGIPVRKVYRGEVMVVFREPL